MIQKLLLIRKNYYGISFRNSSVHFLPTLLDLPQRHLKRPLYKYEQVMYRRKLENLKK
jgi:hypothetical protein